MTDTCENCADDFIPVHDETLCRKCTEAKEDEWAWRTHGLPTFGAAMRETWIAGYQQGRKDA